MLRARVTVDEGVVGAMGPGLLAFVGVGRADTLESAAELARKLVQLRIFEDAAGRMNASLLEVGGSLGIVSQFTLFGDVRRGRRPSFTEAASPDAAEPLIEAVCAAARSLGAPVITGRFRAQMQVELLNDGPVTLLVDTERRF